MRSFLQRYVEETSLVNILDVGAYSICGSYKDLITGTNWNYIGADMAPGPNVDIVLKDPYDWGQELLPESFDVVISGQVFEHIEFPWETVKQIDRVLVPGGLVCIIAPSAGVEHKYPVDCYRYYPDGMRALAKWAKWTVIEAYFERDPIKYPQLDELWQDCVLIAKK